MPKKIIRIEPVNAIKEAPVEQPVAQPVEEPLPERTNCTDLSDNLLAAIVGEVKGGHGSSSHTKTNKTTQCDGRGRTTWCRRRATTSWTTCWTRTCQGKQRLAYQHWMSFVWLSRDPLNQTRSLVMRVVKSYLSNRSKILIRKLLLDWKKKNLKDTK